MILYLTFYVCSFVFVQSGVLHGDLLLGHCHSMFMFLTTEFYFLLLLML